MPYPKDHKEKTRARIVEAARQLFNAYGYDRVSLDDVMAEAGLTRGGSYAYFKSKEALFAAAVDSFLNGRGKQWRDDAGIDPTIRDRKMAERMIHAYLSPEHLEELNSQCPLIALSSDIARQSGEVRDAYQRLLTAMVWLYEVNLEEEGPGARQKALSLAALSVGGMILARTLPDSGLAQELRAAALETALESMRRPAVAAE